MRFIIAFFLLAIASAAPELIARAQCTTEYGNGDCVATSSCKGWSVPGHCAGAKNIQCCVKQQCKALHQDGLCQNDNKPCGKSYLKDLCPGGNDIQCCPVSAPADSSPSQPVTPTNDACTNPKRDTCDFYSDCLETKHRCGSDGYPLGYGLRYCRAFTGAKQKLSSKGDAWVSNTMLCLQRALVPFAKEKTVSCAGLKSDAIATHPDCYVKSGVCVLPPTDWAVIVATVSLKDLFGGIDNLKAVLKTTEGCIDFYEWLIEKGIIFVVDKVKDAAKDVWDKVTDFADIF